VKVDYQSVGSGAGIQMMVADTFAFGCTDRPMTDAQIASARSLHGPVLHIPLALGAVVPIYNLPNLEQPLRFSGPVLADIFLGKVKKWSDKELAALNPGIVLPDLDILVLHRSDGNRTTYIWTDYLSKVSSEWKETVGVGYSLRWPVGEGHRGGEGVAGPVLRTPGAISYVELIYALQNNIRCGSVQNKEGVFVLASLDSVMAAASASLGDIPQDLRYSLVDAPGKDSYPISGTVWAVVYADQPAEYETLVDFLRWITHKCQEYCAELHYARLPKALVDRIDKKLQVKSAD
jgi:phosphate transport system substrate-binding protein